MKKYTSITSLLTAVFFMLGMSSTAELEDIAADKPSSIKKAVSVKMTDKPHRPAGNYSKPHAGIYLDYQRPEKLQVGDSLALELRFKVRAQAEQLQVKVNLSDALLLQSDSQYEFDTAVTKNISVTLLATALKEDSARINLSATILVDGRYQSRSFSIPITIGDSLQFKSSVKGVISTPGLTVDKAHGVVSMPAVESSN